jgi:hypothetical protein
VAVFDLIEAQYGRTGGSNPHTLTFTATIPTGSLVLAWARNNNLDAGRSITDNKGNTYTRVADGDSFWGDWYYAVNVTGGASFAVSHNNSVSSAAALIILAFVGDANVVLDNWCTLQYNGGGVATYDFGDCATSVTGALLVGSLAGHLAGLLGFHDTTGFTTATVNSTGDYVDDVASQYKLAGAAGNYRETGTTGSAGQTLGQVIAFKGALPAGTVAPGTGTITFAGQVTTLVRSAFNAQRYMTPFVVRPSGLGSVDFVTLVDRTLPRFKSVANSGHVASAQGYDLIPYADAGCTQPLDYEREFYDPTTGQVVDWVRVPELLTGTTIYYGYGDPSITTDRTTPAAVWINHHLAVYHLGASGGTLVTTDSTAHGYHATNSGVTATAGRFGGGGALFDAASDKIYSGATVSDFSTNANWGMSCWFKPTFASTDTNLWSIFGSWNLSTNDPRAQMLYRNDIGLYTEIVNSGTSRAHQLFPTFSANTWHYIVLSHPGAGTPSIWFDGTALTRVDSGSGTASVVNQPFVMGERLVAPACGFSGVLDEVRYYDFFTDSFQVGADYVCQGDQATWWGATENEVPLGGIVPGDLLFAGGAASLGFRINMPDEP